MAVMAKPLSHAHAEEHDHEAELRKEHLLLDPRPRGEMNAMVMDMMQGTSWKFWLIAAIFAGLVLWGLFYSWGMMIANGLGLAGVNQPVYWGLFLVHTVFLDRHQPRWHICFGPAAGFQSRIPAALYPRRRTDDNFCAGAGCRDDLCSHGPDLVGLLDVPPAKPASNLAQFPLSVNVGFFGD